MFMENPSYQDTGSYIFEAISPHLLQPLAPGLKQPSTSKQQKIYDVKACVAHMTLRIKVEITLNISLVEIGSGMVMFCRLEPYGLVDGSATHG